MEQMQITSAQYISEDGEGHTIRATIDGLIMTVPLDPSNRHYAEIMRQVDEGLLVIQEAE